MGKSNLSKKVYIGKSAETSKVENNIYYGSSSNIMRLPLYHRHFLIILQN